MKSLLRTLSGTASSSSSSSNRDTLDSAIPRSRTLHSTATDLGTVSKKAPERIRTTAAREYVPATRKPGEQVLYSAPHESKGGKEESLEDFLNDYAKTVASAAAWVLPRIDVGGEKRSDDSSIVVAFFSRIRLKVKRGEA